jgi:hypothetical protein
MFSHRANTVFSGTKQFITYKLKRFPSPPRGRLCREASRSGRHVSDPSTHHFGSAPSSIGLGENVCSSLRLNSTQLSARLGGFISVERLFYHCTMRVQVLVVSASLHSIHHGSVEIIKSYLIAQDHNFPFQLCYLRCGSAA